MACTVRNHQRARYLVFWPVFLPNLLTPVNLVPRPGADFHGSHLNRARGFSVDDGYRAALP